MFPGETFRERDPEWWGVEGQGECGRTALVCGPAGSTAACLGKLNWVEAHLCGRLEGREYFQIFSAGCP